jgi:hypothetical protein
MKNHYRKGPIYNIEDVIIPCPHNNRFMCTDINQPCGQCLVYINRGKND